MFGDGPKAVIPYDPYRVDTELCVELNLVAEFAGGSIEDWNKRTWAERRMWVYYKILVQEKLRRHEERSIQEMERQRKERAAMPKTFRGDRPGVRS